VPSRRAGCGEGTLNLEVKQEGARVFVVLDLDTGKVMALHYGGLEGANNYVVSAPVLRRLVREKRGVDLT